MFSIATTTGAQPQFWTQVPWWVSLIVALIFLPFLFFMIWYTWRSYQLKSGNLSYLEQERENLKWYYRWWLKNKPPFLFLCTVVVAAIFLSFVVGTIAALIYIA